MQTNSPEARPDDSHLLKYVGLNSNAIGSMTEPLNLETVTEPTEPEEGEEVDEPPRFQTKKSRLWALPLPKLVIVATGAAFVLLVVYALTKSATNGTKNTQPPATPVVTPAASPSVDPQTQAGTLQAEVMLGQQKPELEKLNKAQNQNATKAAPPGTQPAPLPSTSPAVSVLPTYTQRPYVVAERPSRPVFRSPARPVVEPFSRPVAPQTTFRQRAAGSPTFNSSANKEVALPAAKASPQAPEDPYKKWLELASVGGFGSGSSTKASTGIERVDATDRSMNSPLPSAGLPTGIYQAQQTNYPAQNSQTRTGMNYAPLGSSSIQLAVGTRLAGELETPVSWSDAASAPTRQLLIKLQEPLKAADGGLVPYLYARVDDATSNGQLQMSVVSAVVIKNGTNTERSLPPGAVLILGKSGKVLSAAPHRHSRGGGGLQPFLAGLGNAASLVNRATSQSTISSGGSLATTTNNPQPNYLAGFAEGAVQSWTQQMQNRNQQQSSEFDSQGFSLNQGTPVQIFVNQPVAF